MHYTRGADLPSATLRAFLACPSGSDQWCATFMASLWDSAAELAKAGIPADLCLEAGNCHVDDTRNSLVRQFLKTDCTHLVFLDADVGWRASDLVRLIQHGRDVVAGVYPLKSDDPDFPVLPATGQIWADGEGLVEVLGAPTGFMCISRHVLVQLVKEHEGRGFAGRSTAEGDDLYFPVFERGIFDGKRRSGDYAFCFKARASGFRVWIDPEMRFSHTGPKSWEGCLGDFWRKRLGLDNPKLAASIEALKSGDGSHANFCALNENWGNPYAMMPDGLMAAYRLALNTNGPILETGSGLSTLVLAVGAKRAGHGVWALEHDLYHYRQTKAALERFGLDNVELLHAPIREHASGLCWYSLGWVKPLPHRFGAVICDGPNRHYPRHALFAFLGEHIANAQWMFDDASDPYIANMVRENAGNREVHFMGTEGNRKIALALLPRQTELAA